MNQIFATQGGGKVQWINEAYRFIESPPDFPDIKIGDVIPDKWGIAPIESDDQDFLLDLEE